LTLSSFAEILLAHVVDLQTVGGGQFLRIGLDGVAERLGKLGKVEDANPPFRQIRRHPIGVTKHRQRPLHDHPVIARQHASDLLGVTFGQQNESHPPPRMNGTPLTPLFGSGFAGLGRGVTTPNHAVKVGYFEISQTLRTGA
jgi:hypothetical protein